MKFQWSLLFALIFAVIVAIFAVVNVDVVPVNFVFGTAQWPLILVILGSAFLGSLASGSAAIFRSFLLQRRIKHLESDNTAKESLIATQQNEISALNKNEPVEKQKLVEHNQDEIAESSSTADVRSTS